MTPEADAAVVAIVLPLSRMCITAEEEYGRTMPRSLNDSYPANARIPQRAEDSLRDLAGLDVRITVLHERT